MNTSQYHALLKIILDRDVKKEDRTGVGTHSIFGWISRHDLSEGFPIITTKKVSFKNIVVELLWFLRGDTNIKYLIDNGCNIWNKDAYDYYCKLCDKQQLQKFSFEQFINHVKAETSIEGFHPFNYTLGDCGEQYGKLWRNWKTGKTKTVKTGDTYPSGEYKYDFVEDAVDQIANLIKGLKENPYSRRHIITAWNPATLDQMALPACHSFVQFNCRPIPHNKRVDILRSNGAPNYVVEGELVNEADTPKYYLDCKYTMRSVDTMLGLPYNMASYALLTHILCKICNMVPGDLITDLGDAHIYNNHINAAKEQLTRDYNKYELPKLVIKDEGNDWAGISNLNFDLIEMLDHTDFGLVNYQSYPKLENETKLNTGLKE